MPWTKLAEVVASGGSTTQLQVTGINTSQTIRLRVEVSWGLASSFSGHELRIGTTSGLFRNSRSRVNTNGSSRGIATGLDTQIGSAYNLSANESHALICEIEEYNSSGGQHTFVNRSATVDNNASADQYEQSEHHSRYQPADGFVNTVNGTITHALTTASRFYTDGSTLTVWGFTD